MPLVYLLFSYFMMKRIISFFLFAFVLIQINAQKTSVFLFPDFIQGTVLMKNGARTTAALNYDAANRKMMFKQGEDLLILTNAEHVDTIYLNSRKFIPIKDILFLECISRESGVIYVNWLLKNKLQGQKGAYGQITHAANIETINTSYWTNSGYNQESLDAYRMSNENEYWLKINGKYVRCKNKKTLLKLFPNYKLEIEEYIKANKIDFSNTEHMINLLNYCLGLK